MSNKSINRSIRIFVNDKEVKHSFNNVRNEMNRLRREVSRLERGTDEYVKKNAELQKVKKYYNEIRAEMNGLPSLMERLTKNAGRSEEHTSELQSRGHLVCRLLLEKKNIMLMNLQFEPGMKSAE